MRMRKVASMNTATVSMVITNSGLQNGGREGRSHGSSIINSGKGSGDRVL